MASPHDPSLLHTLGHSLLEQLAGQLRRAQSGEGPVLRLAPAQDLHTLLPPIGDRGEPGSFAPLIDEVMRWSNQIHHPRYIGHQIAPTTPVAALMDLVNAVANNGMAIWEMGQLQTVAEMRVVEWMCAKLGFGEQATGHLTSGGSLGNLTALLAAREAKRPGSWTDGENRPRLPCVLVSDQAHYSVQRAVQVLGWGRDGIEPVKTTPDYGLDPRDLPAAYARGSARGREVIAVIGNACTTATGSFDPLGPIADYCAAEKLWMHVDAAHGGSFVLAPSVRDRLAGVERADSVVWDAHKMLMMPALVTGVLFRRPADAHLAFAQHAEYLFDAAVDIDLGHRTFECTKRGMGLCLYSALRVFGESAFRDYLEKTVELSRAFAQLVDEREGFESAIWPQANIVCFRFADQAHAALGRACRRKLVASGKYYVVETTLNGRHHFRVTIVSPMTQLRDLSELLDELEAIARAERALP